MNAINLFFSVIHVLSDVLVIIFMVLIFGSVIGDRIRKWRK